jgi:hypothetical protein
MAKTHTTIVGCAGDLPAIMPAVSAGAQEARLVSDGCKRAVMSA